MTKPLFDWSILSAYDQALARSYIGSFRDCDRRITHEGVLWFARWNLVKTDMGNVFFHVQTAPDPPWLHSHPWDNTTVYLVGEVYELLCTTKDRPDEKNTQGHKRRPGNVVHREAAWSHRLNLETPYAMTLFMTGPMYRHWGFWRDGASPPNGLL